MPTYDMVIRGGTVIDGVRTPRFKADVAIKDGRVAQIGRVNSTDGAEVVDAALVIIGTRRPDEARVLHIRNTLELDELEMSEACLSEPARTRYEPQGPARTIGFDPAGFLAPV